MANGQTTLAQARARLLLAEARYHEIVYGLNARIDSSRVSRVTYSSNSESTTEYVLFITPIPQGYHAGVDCKTAVETVVQEIDGIEGDWTGPLDDGLIRITVTD